MYKCQQNVCSLCIIPWLEHLKSTYLALASELHQKAKEQQQEWWLAFYMAPCEAMLALDLSSTATKPLYYASCLSQGCLFKPL